jgi:D-glycero-alpha-D-manno-heptose 1-phosphate guanylyltransferase
MSDLGKISEAIILAGGKGTRLKAVVHQVPKPMAPIGNQPFLQFQLDYLIEQGVKKVVLAVGYKFEQIQAYFGANYRSLEIEYSIESTPLGTGGAIKLALEKIQGDCVYILNGDTYFPISLNLFHCSDKTCQIAAKKIPDASRYGTLTAEGSLVRGFEEKGVSQTGIINGGIYVVQKSIKHHIHDGVVSFENEILPKLCQTGKVYFREFTDYFIDIGIPEDYQKFREDMSAKNIQTLPIDQSWTLFLDRDGVINERLIDDYVKQLNELEIIKGVPEAIHAFSKLFGRIVVVTNQQGIGKGMMTADDLSVIHGFIAEVIQQAGGKIDQFYFAPQLASEKSIDRKPGIGMGLRAQKEYPEIDFSKSIMIGDSESDIEFGMKLGMKTVMLKNGRNLSTKADYIFETLYQVSQKLTMSND